MTGQIIFWYFFLSSQTSGLFEGTCFNYPPKTTEIYLVFPNGGETAYLADLILVSTATPLIPEYQ